MLFQVVFRTLLQVASFFLTFILLLLLSIPVQANAAEVFAGEYILLESEQDVFSRSINAEPSELKRKLHRMPVSRTSAAGDSRIPYDKETVERHCEQLLAANPKALFCEPNAVVSIDAVPNDPRYSELPGLSSIQAPQAWNVTTGSSDVVVAVLDTGVDYKHPDLADNMWVNEDEIPGNGLDDDGNGWIDDVHGIDLFNHDGDPQDDHSHGTHCAGTIGGTGNNGIGVSGVNWKVRIMALKFLSRSGSGSTFDAAAAVDYAIENGAQVINGSFGGRFASQALKLAIERAEKQGVLFVAAAGNSALNTDSVPHYPSGFEVDNIVSVAAVDSRDKLAFFSNYGASTVDVAAPGVQVLSTIVGGYGSMSGTSMAAPHVAGVAGLVLAANPSYRYLELKNVLVNTVDQVNGLQGKVLSAGRVNASKAVGGSTAPIVTPEPGGESSTEIYDFSGPAGRKRLVRNRPFHLSLFGEANTTVGLDLVFEGRRRQSSCSLGNVVLNSVGYASLSSRLNISRRLLRSTRQVTLRADNDRESRKLRKGLSFRRTSSAAGKIRRKRFKRLTRNACSRIVRKLTVQP